ncbi:MAG: hypothetical protein Q9160_004811 [Pyrenula sp. 1 TL-2023]
MSDSKPIERITLFKVPTEEGLQKLTAAYQKFKVENKRDTRSPYILSLQAGPSQPDTAAHLAPLNRNKDYTFAVKAVFRDKSDMDFYDDECPAHGVLRKGIAGVPSEKPLTVWFLDQSGGQ